MNNKRKNERNNRKSLNPLENPKFEFYHGKTLPFFIDKNDIDFFHSDFYPNTINIGDKVRNDIDWYFFSCAQEQYEFENQRIAICDVLSNNKWDGETKPIVKKYNNKLFYDFDSDIILTNEIIVKNQWSFMFILTIGESYNSYLLSTENKKPSIICGWGKKEIEWFGKKRLDINTNHEVKLIIGTISDGEVTLMSEREKVSNNGEKIEEGIIFNSLGGLKDKNYFRGKIAAMGILNRIFSENEIAMIKEWYRKNYF